MLLDDVIQYRVHILLDSARMEETLLAAQFTLDCELWFTEVSMVVWRLVDLEPQDGAGMWQHSSVEGVSSRSLQLSWTPG